jgi:hypothetical protein
VGDKFSVFIDKYPVSPYLGNRELFIRWMHLIHNKINVTLRKEEILLYANLNKFNELVTKDFITKNISFNINDQSKRQLFIAFFIFLCLCFIFLWI